MEIEFSPQPGSWERHLQRRHQHPELFTDTSPITWETVHAARQKDAEEREKLREDFHRLLQQMSQLARNEKSEVILELKQRVDSLYERCAGLGGDFAKEKEGLRNLAQLIMQAVRASSDPEDQHAQAELAKESEARTMHFQLLESPVIAHLLRPDSPIDERELVPALLCEQEATLQSAMPLFTREQQSVLAQIGRQLLERLQGEGRDTEELWRRLAVMERAAE